MNTKARKCHFAWRWRLSVDLTLINPGIVRLTTGKPLENRFTVSFFALSPSLYLPPSLSNSLFLSLCLSLSLSFSPSLCTNLSNSSHTDTHPSSRVSNPVSCGVIHLSRQRSYVYLIYLSGAHQSNSPKHNLIRGLDADPMCFMVFASPLPCQRCSVLHMEIVDKTSYSSYSALKVRNLPWWRTWTSLLSQSPWTVPSDVGGWSITTGLNQVLWL